MIVNFFNIFSYLSQHYRIYQHTNNTIFTPWRVEKLNQTVFAHYTILFAVSSLQCLNRVKSNSTIVKSLSICHIHTIIKTTLLKYTRICPPGIGVDVVCVCNIHIYLTYHTPISYEDSVVVCDNVTISSISNLNIDVHVANKNIQSH